ncbi:MAG: glucose 1-dehydrogenase [Candidatus Binatia bacterium]
MRDLFDLTDQVAIVTGSTRGLGKAMALGLARAGAAVVITGRKAQACVAAAREIAAATGRETLPVVCHMGDWAQISALVDAVYGRFGRVDVLVNNAGISPAPVPITEVTSEFFDKLYAVNVKGPMRLAALVAPRMAAAGGGSIINVTTVGAYTGGPGVGVYTSSKAALRILTKVMAQEWAAMNVRVNALAPGPFDTDMMRGAERNLPGLTQAAAGETLQKRVAAPDEIVGAVLYLASAASSFVTGEDLNVTGGMS